MKIELIAVKVRHREYFIREIVGYVKSKMTQHENMHETIIISPHTTHMRITSTIKNASVAHAHVIISKCPRKKKKLK